MLRNIIFDMGGVLIRWDPEYFIDRAGIADPADKALLMRAIYASPNWPKQDAGEIDEAEVERRAKAMLPERLHAVAHDLIFHWETPWDPIPGMADFARDCKAAGLGVYLLSNASVRQPEYWPGIPGSAYFDGAVISALEKCVKPGPEIFRVLLDRYRLKAEECLFVDDVQANVQGAEKVGLQVFWFRGDVEELRKACRIESRR